MRTVQIVAPPSFDYEFYKADKPFLHSREEAFEHFNIIGRRAGLKGSSACDQSHLLAQLREQGPQSYLEIGPGCNPRLIGDNVRYFDVKSKAELDQRYKNEPSARVPDEIHYVDPHGSLAEIADKFDIVFSSHVIEHTIDFLGHLNEVESLLNEGGLYVVAAPNKNFTFDYFKPTSVVEDVLAKHFEKRRGPPLSLRSVLLEVMRRTHNVPARHWDDDHGAANYETKDVLRSIANFESTAANSVAMSGFHNWFFTEESFSEIVSSLHALGLTALQIQQSYNTTYGGMTFTAALSRSPPSTAK